MFLRILFLTFCLMSGCATIVVRCEDKKTYPNLAVSKIYPATLLDAEELYEAYYWGWYLGILLIFDIPVSLVSDTICLPHDVYVSIRR